ncbi:MAG TPA: SUMF1/EgtB/PvdO family nonheme iron enzyme [Afifellaceae bacterium]|nr:SUMF1/EgtB/PvdO family nonheme iron enzyme [Afifellaceae bacterium]
MSKQAIERRLAAIFLADMVGYSRLMDIDEEGALGVLNLLLDQVIKPLIAEHRGRMVKQTGDGILAEFASVLEAVRCAIDIQRNLSENDEAHLGEHRIQFRIGINTGDIIIQDNDVYGTGVNVASRLESIAEPGGICLSRPVFDQVKNLVQAGFVYLGEYQVKNIADPIHAFKIDLGAVAGSVAGYDSHAMPVSDKIVAGRAKRAVPRALVIAVGGFIALAVVLGLILILAETPQAPQVPQVVQAPTRATESQSIEAAQLVEPPPDKDLVPGAIFRDCNFCPQMVVVPADTFTMGLSENGAKDSPPTAVTIAKRFAIGKYEITFDEWDACAKGGGCGTYIPDDNGWGRGKQPAINISWNDARAYAIWLSGRTGKSYRLPSEAEWEYAAQAGSTLRFPWGNDINPDNANYGTLRERTLPVGSFDANAFGLYDVIGNVSEWVSDCYEADAYRTHGRYPEPVGRSADNCHRVLRGGSWTSMAQPYLIRTSRRRAASADGRYKFNGFRILREIEQNR